MHTLSGYHSSIADVLEEGPSCSGYSPPSEKRCFEIGNYATAVYNEKWYICEVLEEDENETHLLLSYMEHKGSNQFAWPKKMDTLKTHKDDILCKVQPPIPTTSRFLGLNKNDLWKTRNLFLTWLGQQNDI